ncbi:MAG: nucleoside-diphosphate sugar epimerase/dehydratase [Gammaproteobacteria bacterium]|nr:nucleoside-diphosphate sugar epimerase/dehydratase [Gammaproteobacteria bacterium]
MGLHFKRFVVFAHDLLWTAVAVVLAYWLRFNFGEVPAQNMSGFLAFLTVAVPVHAGAFLVFGCYRGVWRFASIPDFLRIFSAVACGVLVTTLALFLYNRMAEIPRTVLVLYPIFLLAGVSGARVFYRAIVDHGLRLDFDSRPRAVIVGGGRAGEILVRELSRNGAFRPVAILDDDPRKQGQELHGVRIRGRIDQLPAITENHRADMVLIAMPSANAKLLNRIVSLSIESKVRVATLPSLSEPEAVHGYSSKLRPITVEDLLGRESINLDDTDIDSVVSGHSIMVTGGGGSVGSELCRQLAARKPKRLVVFDHAEFNLYRIEIELKKQFPDVDIQAVLGSVIDATRVDSCMRRNAIEMVFHAAAYKHVPIVEENPCEGVRNNVLGTRTVADCAIRNNVKKFILISTDKVVNPSSIMGATKRAAELYCQSLGNAAGTQFITTRFGNVLGSCGSVVPLFESQIAAGGPVTVTDPGVTRYFMTIAEAAGLILQASVTGKGGEVFVLDMGEPVSILHMAETMIRLYGKIPGSEIPITFTGLRPGEKMHEDLFYDFEDRVGTAHPKLLLAQSAGLDTERLDDALQRMESAVAENDPVLCLEALRNLVPTFHTPPGNMDRLKDPAAEAASLRVVK